MTEIAIVFQCAVGNHDATDMVDHTNRAHGVEFRLHRSVGRRNENREFLAKAEKIGHGVCGKIVHNRVVGIWQRTLHSWRAAHATSAHALRVYTIAWTVHQSVNKASILLKKGCPMESLEHSAKKSDRFCKASARCHGAGQMTRPVGVGQCSEAGPGA